MKGDQLLQKETQNHLICCKANILNISFLYGKHDEPTLPGEGRVWLSKKTRFLYGAICVFYLQCIKLSESNL